MAAAEHVVACLEHGGDTAFPQHVLEDVASECGSEGGQVVHGLPSARGVGSCGACGVDAVDPAREGFGEDAETQGAHRRRVVWTWRTHAHPVDSVQGGSLFRIHRDTRFSKDKTPYKTHTALQFRHDLASRDVHAPGFYLGLEPGGSMVGVGAWAPSPEALKAIRDHIVRAPDRWQRVRDGLAEAGFGMMHGDEALKCAHRASRRSWWGTTGRRRPWCASCARRWIFRSER